MIGKNNKLSKNKLVFRLAKDQFAQSPTTIKATGVQAHAEIPGMTVGKAVLNIIIKNLIEAHELTCLLVSILLAAGTYVVVNLNLPPGCLCMYTCTLMPVT